VNRRTFLSQAFGGVLATPLVAGSLPAGRAYRIGLLLTGADSPWVEGFRQGLREHGYAEGKNVTFDVRAAEGRADRLPQLAAELVDLKPDVLVAAATLAALAAKKATRTIPIVMVAVGDPVGSELVKSLARPGGNVTGASLVNVEFAGKRLPAARGSAAARVAGGVASQSPECHERRGVQGDGARRGGVGDEA
jgi:putative ABC transport system substrate-binding protein